MIKKFFVASIALLTVLTLSACGTKEFTVSFDAQGGTAVADVVVEDGLVVAEPTAPTHANSADGKVYSFVGWYTDAAGTTVYNFDGVIEADVTLYASWSLDVVLSFDTKTDSSVEAQKLGENGGSATAPTAPTRTGYTFEGWFMTKRGLTWLEEEAITFPVTVTEATTFYAYWEPVNSKTVDYSPEVTYTQSLDDDSTLVLNPMVYEWSHEDAYVDMMVTDLYTTEVDWARAIAEGVATEILDFSSIEDGTYTIDALDYINVKLGAANFPIDADDEEHLTADGLYDRENGSSTMSTAWTINIREDLYFETGENITASDYEYTVKMFLDSDLNNSRADMFYKKAGDRDGTPLVNGYEYWQGTAEWSTVGFSVDSDYSFTMTFWESVSQSEAMGIVNNIRLAHRATFEASLDAAKTNSSYGTPLFPYVSYGEYIIKTWDANQKVVFNKNYDYIAKGEINYKSIVVEVVADLETRMALFEDGTLNVVGLSKNFYNEYAEAENVFRSWDGYPQYILINTGASSIGEGGNVHPTIMFDAKFRQSLVYGFDRKYFANSVYQPNTPSLLPIPLDTKIYLKDFLYYSQSPQHLAVLAGLGITPESEGYIPARAQTLFTEAYDAWILEGNTGPVTLRLVASNDPFLKDLVEFVEESYEDLFNTPGVATPDKLDIRIDYMEQSALDVATEAWDYDLFLTAVGFGSSTGASWQYPSLNFYGGMLAPYLGLSSPYDESTVSGLSDYWTSEVTVDLTNTWNYLEEYTMDAMVAAELDDWIELYNWLKPVVDDPLTAEVDETKAAGFYVGELSDIAFFPYTSACPWDATASEPYPGATTDMWNLTAMFEEIYLNNGLSIPTVTRSSAIMYADDVEVSWPLYSVAFGWGSQRYRWLTTDPDFMQ